MAEAHVKMKLTNNNHLEMLFKYDPETLTYLKSSNNRLFKLYKLLTSMSEIFYNIFNCSVFNQFIRVFRNVTISMERQVQFSTIIMIMIFEKNYHLRVRCGGTKLSLDNYLIAICKRTQLLKVTYFFHDANIYRTHDLVLF